MSWEQLTACLVAIVAFEAAIIGYMLRHYFMRIERMVHDFEVRIVRLEKHEFAKALERRLSVIEGRPRSSE